MRRVAAILIVMLATAAGCSAPPLESTTVVEGSHAMIDPSAYAIEPETVALEPEPEPVPEHPSVAEIDVAPPAGPIPVPADEWTAGTKIWLARSLIGEVGWHRPGEYGAVAWVYATRASMSKRYGFLEMVKTYSAAIKSPGKARNPWLFELDETAARPRSWPSGPRWTGFHDMAWIGTLAFVDDWRAGKVPNPCQGANHFGGAMDHHRAVSQGWARVKCSVYTRNVFYDSRRIVRSRRRRPAADRG